MNWACIGVLAVAAMASPYVSASFVPAYEVVVRLTIGGGALAMMFDNLYAREYVLAALFAAIALLLNPVLPALFGKRAHSPRKHASVRRVAGLDETKDSVGRRPLSVVERRYMQVITAYGNSRPSSTSLKLALMFGTATRRAKTSIESCFLESKIIDLSSNTWMPG